MTIMRSDVFVYLAGPVTPQQGYTAEDNVASALKVYWECLRAGIPAFCPQMSGAFPTTFSIEYDIWIDYSYQVIKRCTHLLMLPRWQESSGAKLEFEYANQIQIPVVMSLEELLRSL